MTHDWKRGFRTTPVDLAARISAARDAGLPEQLADRLNGDTNLELRADAAALAKALNNVQEDNMTHTTDNVDDDTEEDTPPDDLDPVEAHRRALAGRPTDTAADPLELHRQTTRNY